MRINAESTAILFRRKIPIIQWGGIWAPEDTKFKQKEDWGPIWTEVDTKGNWVHFQMNHVNTKGTGSLFYPKKDRVCFIAKRLYVKTALNWGRLQTAMWYLYNKLHLDESAQSNQKFCGNISNFFEPEA